MDTLFIYFFGKKQNHENCGKKSVLENTQITSLPPFRKKKKIVKILNFPVEIMENLYVLLSRP